MNKSVLVGGIVGGIAFFLLGWVFYGILLMETFQSMEGTATGVAKEEMDYAFLFLGQLSFGFLLAYIFGNWANISTLSGGLKGGAIIGLLSGIGWDLTMYGTSNFLTLNGTLLDIVVWTVMNAICGGIIGMVMGKVK